ncbi:hypothetical protein GOODEAATRI_012648, partial [Goodea atripinnis]
APMFDTSHVFIPPVAFLFNWIGFCLSFCLTNTIAGRYGAICGFGLSLIKFSRRQHSFPAQFLPSLDLTGEPDVEERKRGRIEGKK